MHDINAFGASGYEFVNSHHRNLSAGFYVPLAAPFVCLGLVFGHIPQFKADNAAALALTISTATVNDKAIILAAIAEYESFSENAKAKLESEIALLQGFPK